MENNSKRIGDFVIFLDKSLGKGAFGSVYFGCKASDPSVKVAAKVMSNSNIQNSPNREKIIESIKREIAVLKKISNYNIVQLYSEYLTSNNIYLIMEFCKDGDLSNYRESRGGPKAVLPESEALEFFRHICNGFKALNQAKIIHRDIKPSNILLHEGNAKIADFGFARFTDDVDQKSFMTEVGSPLYMAPEIYCQSKYNAKCDVWSLGILLYELLYGTTPWNATNAYDLFKNNILTKPLTFPENPKRSPKIKDLIKAMLQLNLDHRISWEDIFKHELVCESPFAWKDLRKSNKMDESLTESYIKSSNTLRNQLVQGNLNPVSEKKENTDMNDIIEEKPQKAVLEDVSPKKGKETAPKSNYVENKILFKKIRDMMLYERNVAFFLKGTCHLLVGCFGNNLIHINELFLYQIVFLIQKFEMVLMKYSMDLCEGKIPLEKIPTGEFFASKEYPIFLKQIKSDYDECELIYQQVLNLIKSKLNELKKQNASKEFFTVLQTGLACDQVFCKVYKESIQEFMDQVSLEFFSLVDQNNSNDIEIDYLKLMRFLQIASSVEKPFNFFKKKEGQETSQLFFQFYDEIGQMDGNELVGFIKKNWSK